ncbi:MAG: hypothetical protein RBG13Loki_3516 [Promethearchaeota archaeon CR_4]|nr:MAG: hypothetical protein RBG13Loki_3516 [Candidatus Lokiarchaeota archaeon CR_4]
MMLRFMKNTGISRVENIKELRDVLLAIVSSNWSDASCQHQVECPSEASILYEVNPCLIHDNISKANATDKYECRSFALKSGFSDALELETSQVRKKCLMKGDARCEILLTVKEWQNSTETRQNDAT